MFSESDHGKRILICIKGNCAEPAAGFALEKYMLKLIEEHGLDDSEHPNHLSCTVVNCLGACDKRGPIMTVHPGAIKYYGIDQTAADRIFYEHLLNDTPVEDYVLRPPKLEDYPPRKDGSKQKPRY